MGAYVFKYVFSLTQHCKATIFQDFPGGPVVKTPPSNAGGANLIPGQGTKIPYAARYDKKKKKKVQLYSNEN